MRFAGVLCAGLLGACGAEQAAAPVNEDVMVAETPLTPEARAERDALEACGPVTVDGYCGVRFGMTADQAGVAFPVTLERYESAPDAELNPAGCFELFAAEPVTGISLLVEHDKVGRLDVLTPAAKTADGFGVGSLASDIRTKFGAAASEKPNPFEPEITDLSVMQGATKFVFEIQAGEVRSWRAGVAPTIDYPAHCSS